MVVVVFGPSLIFVGLYVYIYIYMRGIGVGVKGVTGRDAIVHERRRKSSQKAAQEFP